VLALPQTVLEYELLLSRGKKVEMVELFGDLLLTKQEDANLLITNVRPSLPRFSLSYLVHVPL
jgi:hypothetical protein